MSRDALCRAPASCGVGGAELKLSENRFTVKLNRVGISQRDTSPRFATKDGLDLPRCFSEGQEPS